MILTYTLMKLTMTNEVKVETIDSNSTIKWTEKINTIYPETIQVPDYDYGNSQNTLDYNIALRNKPNPSYALIEWNSTQSIPDNIQTQVTILSVVITNDTWLTWTANQITINSAWMYNIVAWVRMPNTGTNFHIMKNAAVYISSIQWGLTLNINKLALLAVWDVITLEVYQNTWWSITLDWSSGRTFLSVNKI